MLAGPRDEATQAARDEYVDEEMLIAERVTERFTTRQDSGFTTRRIDANGEDVLKIIAEASAG